MDNTTYSYVFHVFPKKLDLQSTGQSDGHLQQNPMKIIEKPYFHRLFRCFSIAGNHQAAPGAPNGAKHWPRHEAQSDASWRHGMGKTMEIMGKSMENPRECWTSPRYSKW